jgi:hypothetical protein
LVFALAGLGFVSQGYAGDSKAADGKATDSKAADKDGKAKAAADKVVETAFALKKGVSLRPDQQQAYDKLKQEQEPKLREALEKKDNATSDTEKNAAALAVGKARASIKKQIAAILRQPPPPGSTPQQPQQRPRGRGVY